jgi:RNA polymerase sigma-70 factor (ECF subfamily)
VRDEAELLRDACLGDAQAQSELFAPRIDPLIRLAYVITRDRAAAEDAVQEALASSARHIGALRERERVDTWLRRIVVNHAKTVRRRGARVIPTGDVTARMESGGQSQPGPETELLQREEEARVARAVDALNDRLREPILMRYYLDMREREIARAMRLPVTTVKSRLHAARQKLRAALDKQEKGDARERPR